MCWGQTPPAATRTCWAGGPPPPAATRTCWAGGLPPPAATRTCWAGGLPPPAATGTCWGGGLGGPYLGPPPWKRSAGAQKRRSIRNIAHPFFWFAVTWCSNPLGVIELSEDGGTGRVIKRRQIGSLDRRDCGRVCFQDPAAIRLRIESSVDDQAFS